MPQPALWARWPLTGVSAADPTAITRRPLSVKIENSPAARPQRGLNEADVVYETLVEGGLTRFNCLFQSDVPKVVGPVRSARLSDITIVTQYDALFAFSGASVSVDDAIRTAALPAISPDFGAGAPFNRASDRPAPHNDYLSTDAAYADAKKRGIPTTASVPRLQFGSQPASPTPVASVSIPFSTSSLVRWEYDARSGTYLRTDGGRAQTDAATGKRVSAKNVVVMWAKHSPVGHDAQGATIYDVELTGHGRVSIFREGQRFDGTWEATKDAPPRFKTQNGTVIRLAPGNSWMEVVPLNAIVTMR